jgi:hypothetical protein
MVFLCGAIGLYIYPRTVPSVSVNLADNMSTGGLVCGCLENGSSLLYLPCLLPVVSPLLAVSLLSMSPVSASLLLFSLSLYPS